MRNDDVQATALAVVIPCYRVRDLVLDVLRDIGPEVQRIYVVDDHCPQHSGRRVEEQSRDPRVKVLYHDRQQGVGGATMTGYRQAISDRMDIVVKVDGDGQMDPSLIPRLISPIVRGEADYTKGNRFYRLEGLSRMPRLRLFGNSFLSFLTKLSTGYWDIFDPTNGFTAIHCRILAELPLEKISRGFFFESDLLFRLGTIPAVVMDVPMEARYFGEESNLRVTKVGGEFFRRHLVNFAKRVFYSYYLRNFNIASIELILGAVLTLTGTVFATAHWLEADWASAAGTSRALLFAALPLLVGVQLLLGFFSYDMQNLPRRPFHRRL